MAKEAPPKATQRLPLKIATGIELGLLETRIQEAIARRAYDIYENQGRRQGSDMGDWFRAEEEIERPQGVSTREEESGTIVRTQAPDFSANEIEVGVRPDRVVIWGLKADSGNSSKGSGEPSGGRFGAFLADVNLPSPVNPATSTASFKDGWIEVQLPKAG